MIEYYEKYVISCETLRCGKSDEYIGSSDSQIDAKDFFKQLGWKIEYPNCCPRCMEELDVLLNYK